MTAGPAPAAPAAGAVAPHGRREVPGAGRRTGGTGSGQRTSGTEVTAVVPARRRDMLGNVQTQSLSPVFIGRDAELKRLSAALGAADRGEPQAVLIGGEAGVGKTRLTEEFLAAARGTGAVAAVGACVEIGADGLPFAPVSTALRALYGELGPELPAAVAGQEAELARLLPELGEGRGAPGGSREPHDENGRVRLFELTARLLERLGARRTLVLVLEDLHWADRSTRELLAYLFRSLQRTRVVIAATYRTDDIHRRHPLRPFLAETDRLRTVDRIELSRFSREEVRRQLTAILGTEPAPAVIDDVFTRSDGNPFFVEELACSIRGDCATGISDSLRDLLLVRVETLPEDAQRVARIVAEGGNTVEYRLLGAIAGLGEDRLLDALRSAVGANILVPSDRGEGYRFRHSLVREAVADDLLPGERGRINRRYAEAIEADPTLVRADERAARLATYWYAAHDPAKALPAVLGAAVEARGRRAHAEQHRLLERALELWDETPPEVRARLRTADYADAYPPSPPTPAADGGADGAPAASGTGAGGVSAPDATGTGGAPDSGSLCILDLLAEITVAARLSGERERAHSVAKRALKVIERTGSRDRLRAAWFWSQRSRLTEDLARGDGWEELSRARELVRDLPPSAAHAEVLSVIAAWIMVHKGGAEGIDVALRAAEYAKAAGDRDTELQARVTLGVLRADAGEVDAGIAGIDEVRRLLRERPAAAIVPRTYGNLSSVLEGAGRSQEAVRVAREAQALLGDQATRSTRAWLLVNEGEALISLGRYAEAAPPLAEARRLAGRSYLLAGIATHSGLLALGLGDLDTAGARHTEATELLRHDTQPQHLIPMRALAVELAAAQGRFDDMRRELADGLSGGFPLGAARYAWPLLAAGAAAEADAPEADPDTLARLRQAAAALDRPGPLHDAYALLVRAELSRAEHSRGGGGAGGHPDPGPWRAAQEAFQAQERPMVLARVRFRHAQALLACGAGAREAAPLLAEALGAAQAAGAAALAGQIAAVARAGAVRVGSGRPSGPQDPLGLTARERDVLRLVAQGRTNRQIAEELFISPKTASVHVSNILAKLAVATRGEAAALAHRLSLFP
jgi:DNA-binding CsgD family transcriptional regulator/tetratricopeptide (TPR) repeat protein